MAAGCLLSGPVVLERTGTFQHRESKLFVNYTKSGNSFLGFLLVHVSRHTSSSPALRFVFFCSHPTSYFPTPVPLYSPSLLHFLTHPQTPISLILPFPYSCPRWLTHVYKHNLLTFLYLNQATSPFSLPLARKRGAWRGQERWDSRPRWPGVAIAQSTQIGSPWYLAHSCNRDLQSMYKLHSFPVKGLQLGHIWVHFSGDSKHTKVIYC